MIVLTYTGVEDDVLVSLRFHHKLPDWIADPIDLLLNDLHINNASDVDVQEAVRHTILYHLYSTLLSYSPVNIEEFMWYTNAAVALLLVRNTPEPFQSLKAQLQSHIFNSEFAQMWDGDVYVVSDD